MAASDYPVILPFLTDTKCRRVKQPLTVAYHRLLYVAVRYCKTITTLLHGLEPHLKFQKYIYLTNYSEWFDSLVQYKRSAVDFQAEYNQL